MKCWTFFQYCTSFHKLYFGMFEKESLLSIKTHLGIVLDSFLDYNFINEYVYYKGVVFFPWNISFGSLFEKKMVVPSANM